MIERAGREIDHGRERGAPTDGPPPATKPYAESATMAARGPDGPGARVNRTSASAIAARTAMLPPEIAMTW